MSATPDAAQRRAYAWRNGPQILRLEGERFGILTAREPTSERKGGSVVWLLDCDCGKQHKASARDLRYGDTRSCGCMQYAHQKRGAANRLSLGHKDIPRHLWRSIQTGANRRGITFSLSIEEAWMLFEAQGGKCALSGTPLKFSKTSGSSEGTASLDRIDYKIGYEPGNVQWVHKEVNMLKGRFTNDALIEWACRIAAHGDTAQGGV